MRVSTSKSKNAESFYITKSDINNKGKSTSKIIRKLGTLEELSKKLGTDRDGVMAWAKEQADIETRRYKEMRNAKRYLFHFIQTDSLLMVNSFFIREAISFYSLFTTA